MSDRLALANAIEDAGIPRDKAQRVASVIFDAIHDNVATKADVWASEARPQRHSAHARIDLVEHRLLTRLGGLVIVVRRAVRRPALLAAARMRSAR